MHLRWPQALFEAGSNSVPDLHANRYNPWHHKVVNFEAQTFCFMISRLFFRMILWKPALFLRVQQALLHAGPQSVGWRKWCWCLESRWRADHIPLSHTWSCKASLGSQHSRHWDRSHGLTVVIHWFGFRKATRSKPMILAVSSSGGSWMYA